MSIATVRTTCPYCGVGCGVEARIEDDSLIATEGDSCHPGNRGRLCVKGTHLVDTPVAAGRLLEPVVDGQPTDWTEAIGTVAGRFRETIDRYGPQSVAFYLSGQLLTEDYYVANKLMKGFLGSGNVDTNSRLCMASAVAAHKRAFGEDVVPCSYEDLESCTLLVMVGSNAAWTHPVLYQRMAERQARGELKVVVIDPRRTATVDAADHHLAITPGSDIALFNGLLTYLADQRGVDEKFIAEHTQNFSASLAAARTDLSMVAQATGLTVDEVETFFRLFAEHPQTTTFFSQGINQSVRGTDQCNAIINCHLATGRIGKIGAGPFSITGQPNAMGGREVGGMANQLAAHMDFVPHHIDRVRRFWNAPNVATEPGLKAVDMFDAVAAGKVKAIWIMGTNPAVSLPDSEAVSAALAECPFVVVSECNEATDTASFAHVRLPAQPWGEKDGTVTNSERCISRQRRLLEPLGTALPDWEIVTGVAQALGYADAFNYNSPFEIFSEHVALTAFENSGDRMLNLDHLSDLDASGYEHLEPSSWPLDKRPFEDKWFMTDNGRARFVPVNTGESGRANGLLLNSGRMRDQWHTMSRTGFAPKLFQHARYPTVVMHPEDAGPREIDSGDLVQVVNTRGRVRLLARVSDEVQPGQIFAPIHWNNQFANAACISALYEAEVDPVSGQPGSKFADVECTRVSVGTWALLTSRGAMARAQLECAQFWAAFPHAGGWQYLLAGVRSPAELGLPDDGQEIITSCVGDHQRVLGRANGEVMWTFFASDIASLLPDPEAAASQLGGVLPDWQRLSSTSSEVSDTSRVVCTCFEIREQAIVDTITEGAVTVQALGEVLACGTNCGSCRPELAQYLAAYEEKWEVVSHG